MQQKIWMGMLEVKEMYEPLKFAAQSLTFMKLVYKKKSAERMNKKKKKKERHYNVFPSQTLCCYVE